MHLPRTLVTLFVAAAAAGCNDIPRDPERTEALVRESGAIRLGWVTGTPPDAEGQAALARIEQATGARTRRQEGDSEALLSELEEGKIDLVYGSFATASPWAQKCSSGQGARLAGRATQACRRAAVRLPQRRKRLDHASRKGGQAMIATPVEIVEDLRRAKRLEWWTLAGMGSVIAVMYLAMGSSQAMKTAFMEDLLSLVPAITFLIAARIEPRPPTEKYAFGFVRVNSLAFLASAVVLALLGSLLLFDGLSSLAKGEHPTIAPVEIFGRTVWLGWIMIAALAYSVVMPVVLGRLKQPIAKRLNDKVLHTDADMQKADWQTGMAGIAGIMGVGLGLWWADAVAAALISLSILRDGFKNIRIAGAELLDSVPRALESAHMAADARRLRERLQARWPEGHVRLRESGRYIFANVGNVDDPGELPPLESWMGSDEGWRLAQLSFTPPGNARSDAG